MELPDSHIDTPRQEPWDMNTFVAAYNKRADEFGGWQYTENSSTSTLREDYKRRPDSYPTIGSFANVVFDTEQRN